MSREHVDKLWLSVSRQLTANQYRCVFCPVQWVPLPVWLFVNNCVLPDSVALPRYLCTQVWASGDPLASYMALLWPEVGQPFPWLILTRFGKPHYTCIPLMMIEWWIGMCTVLSENGVEWNKLCVCSRNTADWQDEFIWGRKISSEESPCETCLDGR